MPGSTDDETEAVRLALTAVRENEDLVAPCCPWAAGCWSRPGAEPDRAVRLLVGSTVAPLPTVVIPFSETR